jgi:O-antigen/teichoic acid export membrane protein
MQKPYTLNYLKIYLWQGISIVLNLLSMFIVTPRLADNHTIYGIYIVCISANIFLTYADIGFAGAGYKYASECFAQKNLGEEIRIVAFVGFVLSLFVALFVLTASGVALNPGLLIKNIRLAAEIDIASHLLFILAFFAPVIIFQRVLDIVYGVRLEQYITQRIMIGASILKILSVFYFFQNARYDIVGYYLFCQTMNLLAVGISAGIVKKKYGYEYRLFFKSFKFSKEIFDRTKKLSFASLFITFAFILYYEVDSFVIVRLLGPEYVAVYAIGFTILTFLRNIYGVVYSPFLARFNHFIGIDDMDGLRGFYRDVIVITMPIVIFPILSLIILMKPFVHAWVGGEYRQSVLIAQFLISGFLYMFLANPASFLLISQERIKWLYLTSAIQPVIYWGGVLLTISSLGLVSFGLFKFVTFTFNAIIYFVVTLYFLKKSFGVFFVQFFRPMVIPLLFLALALFAVKSVLPLYKDTMNLFLCVAAGGLASFGALLLYACFSKLFRKSAGEVFRALGLRAYASA